MAMASLPPLGLMLHVSLTGKTVQQQKMPAFQHIYTHTCIHTCTANSQTCTHVCTVLTQPAHRYTNTHPHTHVCKHWQPGL